MNFLRVVCGLLLAVSVSGCKVQITVPEGGRVVSESGAYVCEAGETCAIDVVDTFFDEVFFAKPATGYRFTAWRKRGASFCGGKQSPCPLSTTFFPDTPLMQFLESDSTFFLEPVFGVPNTCASLADLETLGAGISSCAVKGKIYVFGIGWGPGGGVPQGVAEYDMVSDTWAPLPNMPVPRGWATTSVVRNKCYVIGGASQFGGPALDVVEEFTPATGEWRSRAPLPEARTLAASATAGGKIFVLGGGTRDSFFASSHSRVAIYDPAIDKWDVGAEMPTPRHLLEAAAIDGHIYAIGGRSNATGITSVVERYNSATNVWTTVARIPAALDGHSAGVLSGLLYSFGGNGSSEVNLYDPSSDQWKSRADMIHARWGHTSAIVDGQIIAIGGITSLSIPSAVEQPEVYTPQ